MIVNKERMLKDIKALKRIKEYCATKPICDSNCCMFNKNVDECTFYKFIPNSWDLKRLKKNIKNYKESEG